MRSEKILGKTINFEEGRHIFTDEKGKKIISVTGVTGVVDKSGALMGWVAKCMALFLQKNWDISIIQSENDKLVLIEKAKKEYRTVQTAAADIGTMIHEWIASWIKGEKPEIPNDEKIANGITAFLKWQKEHKAKFIESERIVYSKKYNYAGILDAVGIIDGQKYLIDFKSSNGIYDEMILQVAGYRIAYEEITGEELSGSLLLRLGKDDGEFEVKDLSGLDKIARDGFIAALKLKNSLKKLSTGQC